MKILLAGSTGYLGTYILKEFQNRKFDFKAIARNSQKLLDLGLTENQIIEAEVTLPETLEQCCQDIDVVISTIGITRQKDGLTYMDVDYQANKNLLKEAVKSCVKKFIYISAINGDKFRFLKIFEAKEKFVDELKNSGLNYTIMHPNGFFSDMQDFPDMAKGGRVYLFGNGKLKLNPIHGADLAKVCVDAFDTSDKEIVVRGPVMLTQNDIAEMALQAWNKPIKIMHLPDWTHKLTISLIRTFTSSKTYGPIEFFMIAIAIDNIAPCFGSRQLKYFFNKEVEHIHED